MTPAGPVFSVDKLFEVWYELEAATEHAAVVVATAFWLANNKLFEVLPLGPLPTENHTGRVKAVLHNGQGSTGLDKPIFLNGDAMQDPRNWYFLVTPVHELMHRYIYSYGGKVVTPIVKHSPAGQQMEWMIEGLASWAPIWVNNYSPSAQKIDDAFKNILRSIFMRSVQGRLESNAMYGAPFWVFIEGMKSYKDDKTNSIVRYLEIWKGLVDELDNPSGVECRNTTKEAVEWLVREYTGDRFSTIDTIYNEYVLACTGPFWRMQGIGFERTNLLYRDIQTAARDKIGEYKLVATLYGAKIDLATYEPPYWISLLMEPGQNALLIELFNYRSVEITIDCRKGELGGPEAPFIISGAQINKNHKGEVEPWRKRVPAEKAKGTYTHRYDASDGVTHLVLAITREHIWPYQEAEHQDTLLVTLSQIVVYS